MQLPERLKHLLPKGFLWRLTFLNIAVIAIAIGVSGWAVYNTACFLVEGMGHLDGQRQRRFNATLRQYFWVFSLTGVVAGSFLHYYFTKKLINPVRQLIESTKRLQKGEYPDPVESPSHDEVGRLVQQFNNLIHQLQSNEEHRHKLVSDLSHEFRTPLSNLNGYLRALQGGVIEGNPKLYESLYLESKRLTQMIEQLDQLKEWDYAASQTIARKETVNIGGEIDNCVAMFEWKLSQADIQINVELDEKEMTIQIQGIQQVVSNLLDNAIQYYEGFGPISIQGEAHATEYLFSITGPGTPIVSTEKNRIFERFYRVDASRSRETGGSGLGLAIAKEIIERHHGRIGVEPMEGANRFWFVLPFIQVGDRPM
ncbi:ATP-binding protein [Filibacter tadaridae]|uniref:Heme sensor protein HssS n=1 Tax=Filibacter tadaridae TaxID=2483811 RepID=A0A3P5X573_9BACL|nr:ATP-binding protein [Filibacter tadaridae]VDC29642.1 Signal transduction histidine-protein kinase BaeS [Filibacter tadaridae]